MRKLLAIAIPSVLAAGMVAAAVNEPDTQLSATNKGEVTEATSPAVIEVPATEPPTTTTLPPETTTTTAPPAPPTTMAAPPTTAPKATTAQAPKPKPVATSPTTAAPIAQPQPQPVDCGTGSAGATAQAYMNGSTSLLRVVIKNATNKHIEIDKLVVYATYNGERKTFNLPVAGQRVIASEDPINNPTLHTIEIPESASQVPPTSLERPEFSFHTAGLPECAAQPVG